MPRPRIRPAKPSKPGAPPPSVAARVAADPAQKEVLVEEALLLVGVALRLQMENLIILRTLRERRPYDEDSLIEALRGELAELVGEKRGEAERLRMARDRAALRDGKGRRPDDYREGDVPGLRLRAEIAEDMVERLGALSRDPEALREVLVIARDSALEQIVRARLAPQLLPGAFPAEGRDDRVGELRDELARLAAERERAAERAGARDPGRTRVRTGGRGRAQTV
ncbi:hypothetical protein ABID70_002441 [Clavibacter michiganensis]|uniref:hypothetical protein n=1 Tax=Clavibacter michiganensis TaxID=28447 RepID=UPI001D3D67AE|nr:hypothetical protein [Clavibacter michiganensis]MBP2456916.1 hypothetical protein [Clavibacter michiganensis]MDQ0409486.1 hypothetical protein [Clavibacter michiganensis]